jgi:transposase
LTIPQGIINVAKKVPELLQQRAAGPISHLIERLTAHLKELDRQVKEFEKEIIAWHRSTRRPMCLTILPIDARS